jgi:hypothetical protein
MPAVIIQRTSSDDIHAVIMQRTSSDDIPTNDSGLAQRPLKSMSIRNDKISLSKSDETVSSSTILLEMRQLASLHEIHDPRRPAMSIACMIHQAAQLGLNSFPVSDGGRFREECSDRKRVRPIGGSWFDGFIILLSTKR